MTSATALATTLGAPPALAHPPHSAERILLAEPAVVRIETSAQADVVLHGRGVLHLVQQHVTVPGLAAGSGVVVNPNGVVVTSADVVRVNLDRARTYAVNKVFAQFHRIALPGDPFRRQRLADPALDAQLQNCYRAGTPGSECVTFFTPQVRVFPFVDGRPAGLPAEVLRTGNGADDVAVLTVGGTNMPTVGLAPGLAGMEAIDLLGFRRVPAAGVVPDKSDAHLAPPGSSRLTAKDSTTVTKALGGGLPGAPVIEAAQGRLVGLVAGDRSGTVTLLPANRIAATLKASGVAAARGPADTAFATAMGYVAGRHYTHAVPRLSDVLQLYPGHALAARTLKVAQAKKGTPEDLSLTDGNHDATAPAASSAGGVWLRILGVTGALAVLGLALIVAFTVGRRLAGGGELPLRLPQRLRLPWGRPGRADAGAETDEADGSEPEGGEPEGGGPEAPGMPDEGSRAASGRGDGLGGALRHAAAQGLTIARQRPAARSEAPIAVDDVRGLSAESAGASIGVRASSSPVAVRPRFCTNCGAALAAEHRFCGHCGSVAR